MIDRGWVAATVFWSLNESVMMPLKHPQSPNGSTTTNLSLPPVSMLEGERVPRHTLPAGELPPEVAYQIIHDELMIDGNARRSSHEEEGQLIVIVVVRMIHRQQRNEVEDYTVIYKVVILM